MLTMCCTLCFNFGEDLYFVASCSAAGESEASDKRITSVLRIDSGNNMFMLKATTNHQATQFLNRRDYNILKTTLTCKSLRNNSYSF